MNAKEILLEELETAMVEFNLKKSDVGLAISGSPSFIDLMRDPKKSITTNTIDKINRYILSLRGQTELDLN